jgi:predicted ATPase
MHIKDLYIQNYRSIRDLKLRLGQLNVVTGPNGCGKSNLYRAVRNIAMAARGELTSSLAAEGGMPSALWAGKRKKGAVRMRFGILTDRFCYELACGLPTPNSLSLFGLDPEVKEEYVWFGERRPATTLLKRQHATTWVTDDEGRRISYPHVLDLRESVLSQLNEPHLYPELSELREMFKHWRFYHHFDSSPSSPIRRPQTGFYTPILSSDGHDLAAALQTIIEHDPTRLYKAIGNAFPGAELRIKVADDGQFGVEMAMPGVYRPLRAVELSDGTIRFLCLAAALLSRKPPLLLALNEPESSLHPELIDPLADLIVDAAEESQLWVTSHSHALCDAIADSADPRLVELALIDGETVVPDEPLIRVD